MAIKKKNLTKSARKNSDYTQIIMFWTIGIGVIWRFFYFINHLALSNQEQILMQTISQRDFWGLFNPLDNLQVFPPLFLSLVKIFISIPTLEFVEYFFKLVPFISSILAIFAFYHLLKHIFVNKNTILIGLALFVCNFSLIEHSANFSIYSTDVLITILLITYFIRYNPDGYWRQFLQVLLLSFLIMVSFPAFFVLLGGLLLIFFKDYKKFFYAFFAFALFNIFYFIYHIWGIMEFNGAKLDAYWTPFFVNMTNLLPLTLEILKLPFNNLITPFIQLIVLGLGFFISCFYDKKFAILTFGVITSLLIFSYLHIYPYEANAVLFLIPLFIILMCEILDIFFKIISKK